MKNERQCRSRQDFAKNQLPKGSAENEGEEMSKCQQAQFVVSRCNAVGRVRIGKRKEQRASGKDHTIAVGGLARGILVTAKEGAWTKPVMARDWTLVILAQEKRRALH